MSNSEDHLLYLRPPPRPHDFDKKLKNIVGINDATGQPWLRYVWGCDRKEFNAGEMIRRYPDPDGKYIGLPFWVLEGWQSPSVLDRAEWTANEEVLGPFPENGTWDFIEVLRTEDYRFVPLGEKALQKAREWRIWKNKPRTTTVNDLVARFERIRTLKDKRWQEAKAKIYGQMVEDMAKVIADGEKNAVSSLPTNGGYDQTPSGVIFRKTWN